MLSNDELKEKIANLDGRGNGKNLRVKFLDIAKNGGFKWADVRGFQTIIYKEHFKDEEEVFDSCRAFGVPCTLSPLHDKDIKDLESGELKKEHYHLLAYYKGKTSLYRFYVNLCGAFGEDSFFGFDDVANWNLAVRYHCHLDDKDKAQYDIKDIKDFNGFSSQKYLMKMDGDDVSLKTDLKRIIKENNFIFYNELDDYLEEYEFDIYSSLTMNKALRREIIDYLKAREHQMSFDGLIEKSMITEVLADGRKKQIFNRQIKVV